MSIIKNPYKIQEGANSERIRYQELLDEEITKQDKQFKHLLALTHTMIQEG